MRYLITLTLALCSWCPWLAAQTTAPAPLAVVIGESPKVGLSVVKIELPSTQFERRAQGAFLPEQWRIVDRDRALRQLYAIPSEDNSKVDIYGLVDKRKGGNLDFYFARDWMHFGESVFSFPLHLERYEIGADTSLAAAWATTRNRSLVEYLGTDKGNELPALWVQIADRVYRSGAPDQPASATASEPHWPTLFSLFSGEAAIQETLQQQLLTSDPNDQADGLVSDLSGPEVASHPFQQWLQDKAGATLEIADLVPAERYFVYFNDPGKALDVLDQLADNSQTLIGLLQQSYQRRDLLDRYLQRLGLSREGIKQLGPLAHRIAFFGPDPLLDEGTHLTLIVEAASSPALERWLSALPVTVAEDSEAAELPLTPEGSAYFARHERWLIFSTSASEAAAALQLARDRGQGSLGQSAEFRYMLSQLPPPDDKSGMYLYLSDPFIRALVGPRLKIAQLRREQARARLRLVTAAALLYQLDHQHPANLDELLQQGYVDKNWLRSWEGDQVTLDDEGIAQSSLYGTLADMTPLIDLRIDAISAAERNGYQQYVADYTRYWRTYFDPIGIRVTLDAPLRIETLILPLVQNSIYQALRQMIGGDPVVLSLPSVLPTPVTTLGMKLPRTLIADWVTHSRPGDKVPSWVKELGDSLYIAVYDSDPLIAMGSADLLGAFSGPWMDSRDLLLWGLLGSWLSQPTAVFVKLKSAEGAIDELLLEDVLWDWIKRLDLGDSTLEQFGQNGARGWVYTLNIEGLLRFHLYIRKIYQYLVISNRQINFRADTRPTAEAAPTNASLTVAFDQIQELAPTLHLHRMQRQREAVMKNIGRLLPFMLLGADTVDAAIDRYERIFGSRPEHPPGGRWVWQALAQLLSSDVFGSPWLPRIPSYYDPNEARGPAGIFDPLQSLELNFRFADEGARIVLSLTSRAPGNANGAQ